MLITAHSSRALVLHLSKAVLHRLQVLGLTRVRVTVTPSGHGGRLQSLWLRVPLATCTGDGDHDADDRGAACFNPAIARKLDPYLEGIGARGAG